MNEPHDLQIKKSSLSAPALPKSDRLLEIAKPEIRSFRANRAIRPNDPNVKILVNGISIEINTSVSEEFLSKFIKTVCHA